jgi:hypothetical protein
MSEDDRISKDSTLTEMFDYFDDGEGGMRVVPISIKNDADNARQLVAVMGAPDMVHHVMARFMAEIEELSMMVEQKAMNEEPVIESVDGKKLNGAAKVVTS